MRAEAQVLAHIHPEFAWLSCTLVSISTPHEVQL